MSTYYHGAYVREVASGNATPTNNESGLHVIFGTAPIHLAEEPRKTTDRLILANSFGEAVKKLGYSEDFKNYTLCQAMSSYFKVFAVGPVVLCNVLDPEKHKKDNVEKEYTIINKQVTVDTLGILSDTLIVKTDSDVSLVKDTDYITSFDSNGYLIITMLSTGQGTEATKIKVSSTSIAPETVTEADVIGGIDAETGKESGLELVRRVYPVCGRFPGLLLAPGWSHKKNVAAVLSAKCREINGVFRCECLIDLDTEVARKYSDCAQIKEEYGLNSEDMILLWPKASVSGVSYYYSAIYGAMTAQTDADNDSIPTVSPSNRMLRISGSELENGQEINLDQPEGNALNGHGIVTILNNQGFRSWGNNTAAYPEVTDTKDRWICCRRAFSWYGNAFIVRCAEEVDNPANNRLIETIVDKENIRGNSYVQQGKFAGAKMEYRAEDNTREQVLEGKIQVRQYLAPFTPAEYILNVLSFDPTMLENALGGSE